MTYVIVEPCIGVKDEGRIAVCSMDCVHGTDSDEMFYSDPEECIDCGACVPACLVEAILAENEVPEQWKHFAQINADYFKDKR